MNLFEISLTREYASIINFYGEIKNLNSQKVFAGEKNKIEERAEFLSRACAPFVNRKKFIRDNAEK